MNRRLTILLLIVGCKETTEPEEIVIPDADEVCEDDPTEPEPEKHLCAVEYVFTKYGESMDWRYFCGEAYSEAYCLHKAVYGCEESDFFITGFTISCTSKLEMYRPDQSDGDIDQYCESYCSGSRNYTEEDRHCYELLR